MIKILMNGHTVQDDIIKVIDPILDEKANTAGTLEYSILYNDPYFDEYIEGNARVEVIEDNISIFRGRLLENSEDFYNTRKVLFEGELTFLNDIMYPPYDFHGSPEEFIDKILDHYNSKCTKGNEIHKGIIEQIDSNNYIARSNSDYSSCYECIKEKLIDLLGGYIQLRYANDIRYLDYTLELGRLNSQKIEFKENILDLTKQSTAESVYTVIIPLGAQNDDGTYVTIESVNNGLNYIESTLVSVYGRKELVVKWNDVTLPSNLLIKAKEYLSQCSIIGKTITVNALDLHMVNVNVEKLHLGRIHVISKPHGLDSIILLTDKTRNLNSPENDTVTLGTEIKTFTSNTKNQIVSAVSDMENKNVEQIKSTVKEQTDLITGGKGGYLKTLYNDRGLPIADMIMDAEDESKAKNVILRNEQGISYSTNGISGPFKVICAIDGKTNADSLYKGRIQSNDLSSYFDLEINKAVFTDGLFSGIVNALEGYIGIYEIINDGLEFNDIREIELNEDQISRMQISQQFKAPNEEDKSVLSVIAIPVDSNGEVIGDDIITNIFVDGIRTTGTINSYKVSCTEFEGPSDRRLKKNIKKMDMVFIDIWKKLRKVMFQYNDKIKDDGIIRFGLIAQEVINVFKKYNLNPYDYGLITKYYNHKDKKEYLGINYEQFSMMTAQVLDITISEYDKKIDVLEERIRKIERELKC